MNLTVKAALLASVSAWAAGTALAQDVIELDAIRVEAEAAQEVLGNHRIDEEDLEDRNPQTMADIFAGETEITSSGGSATGQKVYVHGIEETNLNVTIDGARQNKSAFHHTGNVLIDPYLLKQVNVSSGLAPADQGPGALGGAIAYETKDARDLLEPGDTFGGFATLGYSDNGNTFTRGLTVYGTQGNFEYLLSGKMATGDAYQDAAGTTVTGTAAGLSNYMAKLAYTTDSGKRLEFSADHTTDEALRAGQLSRGNIYIRPNFLAVVGATPVDVLAESARRSYTLTYTDEAPDGIWAPTLQLAYNEQELDGPQVTRGLNTSLSGVAKNEFMIGSGVLTAGVDFFHDTAKNTGPTTAGVYSREQLTNVGVFAQMRQDLGDRVSLSYGLRADTQSFRTPDGQKFDDAGLSVNAAIDVRLTDALTLNVGAASVWGGYELSEASLINTSAGAGTLTPWAYANIRASRANNARIGLRYESGPWSAGAAAFYTELKNAPYVFTADRNGGAGNFYPTLKTQGIDASLRYDMASGYVAMNYTYAEVTKDGAPVTAAEDYWAAPGGHSIGLSAAFEVTEGLTLGGNATIVADLTTGGVSLPGYEVVNAFATYTPQQMRNVEIRLDVRNIFDEQYSVRTAGGVNNARAVPLTEPGRTIGLTVTTKF